MDALGGAEGWVEGEVPPWCPAAAATTNRLPPSSLCQAAVGGDTQGGPVQCLGTKQPRLKSKSPCKSPFLRVPPCADTHWQLGGIKIALWRKVQSPLGKSGTGKGPFCSHFDQCRARKLRVEESWGGHSWVHISVSVWCPLFLCQISDVQQKKRASLPRMYCLNAQKYTF